MSKTKTRPKKASLPAKRAKYIAFVVAILAVTLSFGVAFGEWRNLPLVRSLVSPAPHVLQPVPAPTIPPPANASKEYIYGGGKLIATESAKSDQTITFNSISDKTYGDAPFSISGSASSGLAVSFTVTSGPATVSGATVTFTGAGAVTITAAQAGNDGFNAAPAVTRSFNVAKATTTVNLTNLTQTYDGAAHYVSVTTSPANLNVSLGYNQGGTTVSSPTNAGSYAATATVNDSNYQGNAAGSLTITKAAQTITFNTLAGKTYGDAAFAVSASSTSGLATSFSIVSGPATVSGTTVTLTGTGSVTVRASQGGNSNYNAAAVVDQPFNVAAAAQTITFNTLANKTYGDAPFTVSASSSSGLSVSFSTLSGPATISGTTVTLTGAGTVTVRAAQAGNSNYNAAANVDRSFNVAGYSYRRSITIDYTKVPNTDQSNFPVLISGTYSYLATVANGGNVQSSNGCDIIFTSDSVCTNKLSHEVESYSGTTGAVNYWVKVPTVSHTSDTTIYMCYGNSSITTDQSNKTAVWDANYKGVWHLPNGSTLSSYDSSAAGNNGTNHSATAASVKINGGANFDGSSQSISIPQIIATNTTVEHWMYRTASAAFQIMADTGWNNTDGFCTVLNSNQHAFVKHARAAAYTTISSPLNTWEHVVWTVGADNKARLYVNGALSYTDTDTQAIISPTHGGSLGSRLDASGNPFKYFPGILDEVRISGIARSADWIATEYNNQNSPVTFYAVSSSPLASGPRVVDMTAGTYKANNTRARANAGSADDLGILTRLIFYGASLGHVTGIDGSSLTFLSETGEYGWLGSGFPQTTAPPQREKVNHPEAGSQIIRRDLLSDNASSAYRKFDINVRLTSH